MSLRSYILQIMLYGTNHLKTYIIQARVQGGGLPPPLEIEKPKKIIRANIKLFHLYFATFFSRKYYFLS